MTRIRLAITVITLPAVAYAEGIHGPVIVKQRLATNRVTAAPTLDQRGQAVELRSDPHDDPLAAGGNVEFKLRDVGRRR